MKKKDLQCCGNCVWFSSMRFPKPYCLNKMKLVNPSGTCNKWDHDCYSRLSRTKINKEGI